MDGDMIFAVVCGAAVLIMAFYYLRREHRVRTLLFGSLTGIAALLILNEYGGRFSTQLPLNVFNVAGSAVLGVPFVIILVLLEIL